MTSHVFADDPQEDTRLDILAPERVTTLVAYLASPASAEINGQVFVVYGDMIALLAPPTVEQRFIAAGGTFTVDEVDEQLTGYFTDRDAHRTYAARSIAALDATGIQNIAPRK
jgi:3-oxoacyl-[acyl-carrier protein] reductase